MNVQKVLAEVQEQDLTSIILLPVMLVVSAQNIKAYHLWIKPHLISSHQKVQYPEIQYGDIHFTQLHFLLSSAACRHFWPLQDLTLLFIHGRPAISGDQKGNSPFYFHALQCCSSRQATNQGNRLTSTLKSGPHSSLVSQRLISIKNLLLDGGGPLENVERESEMTYQPSDNKVKLFQS